MIHTYAPDSSNIHELAFDDERDELIVTFKGGVRYRYADVKRSVYDDLIAAESVGKHFAAYVKNDYPATRLRS